MINRLATLVATRILLLLSLLALIANVRIWTPASAIYDAPRIQRDVLPQMRFLRHRLDTGAGEAMQELFPEGYFFMYALYGLAWVDVGLREETGSPRRREALREGRWALAHLDSTRGKAVFSAELDPPYGVFYVGWRSWLQGGVLKLQDAGNRIPGEVARFEADCDALAAAYARSSTPFLKAYPGAAWPVDNTVAIAALRLHDSLFAPRYADTITKWCAAAKAKADASTGLLPHEVDPDTGDAVDMPRATSLSLMTRFLYEIDPVWGRDQYERYRTRYVATPLAIPGVREFPRGVSRRGDVDSGPLVMGLSGSASVVTIGAAQVHGDTRLALALLNSEEAAGLPMQWGGEKSYGFGLLPVADAFIAWSKVSQPWVAAREGSASSFKALVPSWWRWAIHAETLVLFTFAWWRVLRRPKPKEV